jgi:uncharacterized protein (TIGR03000 family)
MKKLAISAAIVAAALLSTGDQAQAGRGLFSAGSYGSAGSSGGSTGSAASSGGSYASPSSGGSTGDSSGGSSGGPTHRELRLEERAARKAASHGSSGGASHGSTGSSGGSYGSLGSTGSSGSSGGSYGGPSNRELRAARKSASHGSSGGAASHGGSSGAPVHYAPAPSHGGSYGYHSAVAPAAPAYSVAAVRPTAAPQQQFAYVVVSLPQDATLYLGGHQTTNAGAVRKFKIPVNDGQSHAYAVRVVLERDGQNYVAQSSETLQAGKTVSVTVNDVASSTDVQVAAR